MDINEITSKANQDLTQKRVEQEVNRLINVSQSRGIDAGISDAIGTVMGIAHFLRQLGLNDMADKIWADAKNYTSKPPG